MLALALLAAVLAAAAALPLSGSAHEVVLAVASPAHAERIPTAGAIGAAGAAAAPLLLFLRPRAERARRRGATMAELGPLALAALAGAAGHALLEPLAREMARTVVGAGLGLLATAITVGAIGVAPTPTRRTLIGAPAAALAIGLALGALPGGSAMAFGVAALAWCGLPEVDAIELAALGAAPIHAHAAARVLLAAPADGGEPGTTALLAALGAATTVAALGLVGLGRLGRASRVSRVAFVPATSGLALLGYAYVAAPA